MARLLLLLVGSLVLMGGCKTRSPQPGSPGDPGAPADIASVIHGIALWASGIAALVALVALAIAIFVDKRLGLKVALFATVTLVGCQFLFWFASHIGLITVLAVVAGVLVAGVWVWRNVEKVEGWLRLDLNRDGHVGPKP